MTDPRADVGRRVRQLRENAGLTQSAAAGMIGRSEVWWRKVERGERRLTLESGAKLARFFGVENLNAIYGPDVSMPVYAAERPAHPLAEAVGQALTGYAAADERPESADWLTAAAAAAWRDHHNSPTPRTAAAGVLPGLIRTGRATVKALDGVERRQARAALADVMHLAQAYLAWQADARHWYWLAVDQAHRTAEDADDSHARAGGLLYSAFALRSAGREEQALDLLRSAGDVLTPELADGSDDVRGLWGTVQLARASTLARHSRDPEAWEHWEAAHSMLSRVRKGYAHQHGYSAGHVALHRTWIAQALGDSADAIQYADAVDLRAIPSLNWRSSHLVHVSQALHQRRDSAALVPLAEAAKISPEAVQFSLPAREVLVKLTSTGPASVRREASRIAHELSIAC